MKNTLEFTPCWGAARGKVLVAAVFLAITLSAHCAVVTLNPIADAGIVKRNADNPAVYQNYGAGTIFGGAAYGFGGYGEFGLIRFDLSSLPIDAVISSATLKLTSAYDYTYTNSETLDFWQITAGNAGWVEGNTVGGSTGVTGGYANQTSYTDPSTHTGTAWASGGVFSVSAGDLGSSMGSFSLGSGVSADTTYSYSLDTAAVTSWLTNSALANAGVAFTLNGGSSSPRYAYFYTMDSGQPSNFLPQLEITYTAVPEPSSLVMVMGVGAMGFLKLFRRRRA